MKTYSTTQVVKILGLKYQRLREWIDRGYIIPSVMPSGSGSRTEFHLYDIYDTRLFVYLLGMGYGRTEAARRVENVSATVRGYEGKSVSSYDFVILVNRPGVEKQAGIILTIEAYETIPLGELIGDHDFDDAVMVNLSKLRREIDTKIQNLGL